CRDVDLLTKVGKLEEEIKNLKNSPRNLEKTKGKRKLQNYEDNDTTAEIFKKLLSLDARLGNAKGHHDCIISTQKYFYNFMEQHVRSVCSLSGIPDDIWDSKETCDLAISQADMNDPSHATAIAIFTSLQKIK
ncbi:hypothetical protein KI387_044709, partial [Taxus chinensis]